MICKSKKNGLLLAVIAAISMLAWLSYAAVPQPAGRIMLAPLQRPLLQDTIKVDSTKLQEYIPSRRPTFVPSDRRGSPFSTRPSTSPLLLGQPGNLKLQVELDDSLQQYNITETLGDVNYRTPSSMTMQQYSEWQQRESIRNYWREKSTGLDGESVVSSNRLIPKIYISPVFDRIFGGNFVDIQPNGNVSLKFGARFNRNENPTIPLRQQRTGDFEFDQNISLNLVGKIGEKMRINFNWDNNANFDFENNMKLDYTGYDEEIIRKVEAGNVSLPLNNSLITGAQNLFGVKAQLQFGRLAVTTIASSVRGSNDEVVVQNGAQNKPFEIRIDNYDKDRHFYLSQFFRGRYNNALKNLPLVNSGIVIRRMELYVTNSNRSTENLRNMVAYMDLGESDPFRKKFATRPATAPAANDANALYSLLTSGTARSNSGVDGYLRSQGLEKGIDFEHVRARRLDPSEYSFNQQLGYISLNTTLLPDQVLGVAFEYTYNGKTYQVGEMIEDYQNLQDEQVIHMKLLKATNPSLDYPTWDLMMKNVYSLDATQINREDFQMKIIYKDDETGVDITSLKEESPIQNTPLVEVMNLDNINTNNDKPSDGNFDFLPGITIDPETGRIFFPEVEPFGSYLAEKLEGRPELIERYVFQELYDQTQTDAQQNSVKAKFFLQGRFQASSTDEIVLPGFRVAEGSVAVYSGGTRLTEGTDYQVFYDLGRIKILNPSYMSSASDLRVTYEKADLLNIQPRALYGARFDYRLNNDVNLGATVLHMSEQAYIDRVSIGDEPTNNTIYGFDINLQKDSRFLTKLTDAIPLIQTKVPSTVTFSGEFAQLVPSKTKSPVNEDGTSYLDDFEGAETPYSLGGFNNASWRLAATPEPLVPGAGLAYSYNRAKLAWYTIDQIFYRDANGLRPSNITKEELKNHYVRGVFRNEVFPGRDPEVSNTFEYTFDLAYYPRERGQYNYNPNLTPQGLLAGDPRNNYGGISRAITFDTDFDNANIEYIEFWLMDPFIKGPNGRKDANGNPILSNEGGELVLNLGSVSEDILQDNLYSFENGLPTSGNLQNVEETLWGRVTTEQFLTDAFTGVPGGRAFQDVGLDGLNDATERTYFKNSFLDQIPGAPPQTVLDDPSGDNFRHQLDPYYDQQNAGILARYKLYNGMENNSPETSRLSNYAFPDKEDLNKDNVINDLEQYYEYKINLKPGELNVGQNFIVDAVGQQINGDNVTWYQFRVPVRQPTGSVGNISGFKSIRFMRMYLTQFADPVVMRFVQFQFVANQWRQYQQPITDGSPCLTCTDDAKSFTISTVNIEQNGQATEGSTPYVVPPGIERLRDYASTTNRRQNEQSLQLCVEDLKDSFSKAVYKNISLDMLTYKRLKMFVHAETQDMNTTDDDMEVFIRIGTDYTQNYYEYVVPLKLTPPNSTGQRDIWPLENEVDIALDEFVNAKVQRNSTPGGYDRNRPYIVNIGNKSIRVLGNPDFSEVQGVMIGIRNPRKPNDDGRAHSVCMWVDELRVTDFKNQSGWAANARLNTKLADFANITATGAYTTVGFGGLQQKIAQRSRENTALFDVNANIAADKFLPEKSGIKIPVSVQYGTLNSEPQYDPLDQDVPLQQSLERFGEDRDARAAYKKEVTTREIRKSFSLLNVHKERTDPEEKVMPYDIENLSLSYSYAERLFTNIETDRDYSKTYTGALAYTYATTPKNYTPFAESKAFNSPFLRLIKDLNFTPMPSRFAFRADLDRRYNETFLQRRDSETGLITTRGIDPTFQKYFYFNRIYDLKWDISKSLSLDYTATNRAVIDEPDARINSDIDSLKYKNKVIWDNLRRGGRNTNFDQLIALNYKLPLDKFPLTDWIGAETRYAATYIWTASSTALNQDTTFQLGNTAENSTEFSVTGKFDMVKLYNKVKFLKDVNTPAPAGNQAIPAPGDSTAAAKPRSEMKLAKSLARVLMMTRSINFTYLQNRGTMLPGYLPTTSFFGFDDGFDAPGLPFILGRQYDLDQLYNRANSNGWYTDSSQYLNTPFSGILTESFKAQANLEPFKTFNVQVDVRRDVSRIEEVFYRKEYDDFGGVGDTDQRQNPFNSGSFSTSFLALGTLFESTAGGTSAAFDTFIANRYTVRERLQAANPVATDSGYTLNSQDVLIKSFVYAYQGRDINGYKAKAESPFKRLPIPNWRIDYNGLSSLPFFQQWFSQINLTHAYAANYNISNFTTSLVYNQEPADFPDQVSDFGQIAPYYIVSQLTVSERLAPLLGVNFRTKNNLTGRLEYKVERNLSLNLTNAQVTETHVKDYVIGLGYTTTRFRIPFRIGGERKVLDNELTMRLDFSVRDNQTVQRAIARDDNGQERSQNQITNGTRQLQLRPTIDYVLSQRLNLQFYVLRTVSDPKISTSFRNSMTEGGIQLRVSLQ